MNLLPRPPRWPVVGLLAIAVYLFSFDGLYIPHIGDEAPYIEIARLTAESGSWLPLRTAPGLENTKPPLLFWVGVAATSWGSHWSLPRLRLPIVGFTFATALLTFWLARKLGGSREVAWISALTFLGFYSSFQYGRPFLTNSPEAFFTFLAFSLFVVYPGSWFPAGLSLGIACLFKSFALVAPVGLALFWASGTKRLGQVLAAVAIALAVFALWPLLDPDPAGILRHFVLEENLGKFEGQDYWSGLVSGRYALPWLWLGHFGNAGLFAVPLLFLVVSSFQERRSLSLEERSLWILVLSFLIVYSLPSQRQENYLIPTVPALAILLGRRWKDIPKAWSRWFPVPGVLFALVLVRVMLGIRDSALPPGSYAAWQLAIPLVVLGVWIVLTIAPEAARSWFHAAVLASFLTIAMVVAPFEGPWGRFPSGAVAHLQGREVFVPSEFISRQERHRFLLPGARIVGYEPEDADLTSKLLSSGRHVVVHRRLGEEIDGPFRPIAKRYDLRSRQSWVEMWRIFYHGEMDLLVRQELVVRRHRLDRMRGREP